VHASLRRCDERREVSGRVPKKEGQNEHGAIKIHTYTHMQKKRKEKWGRNRKGKKEEELEVDNIVYIKLIVFERVLFCHLLHQLYSNFSRVITAQCVLHEGALHLQHDHLECASDHTAVYV